MAALLSGGIDVGLVGAETSIYVYQQGTDDPAINFAQVTQTDGTFLVSRKTKGEFDWSSLKGASYLGLRKGGMPQMAGEYCLIRDRERKAALHRVYGKQSFIKKKEEVVQKFSNAIYKAQKRILEKSVNEIADAVAPYFKDKEIEIIRSVLQRYKDQGTYASDPTID
ncbi:ABC transporter-like protein [Paenibacillus larvae subsp. larvae DSM 25430]|uniref:ABC transporter-like protein n=2 Tax=Paenibacillus larvae subsp. larvae TaxID=147375 RepID=V9W9C8_9BACL|nr:ABC transporter-like protein [Paenibacillus larvae subsp. larvae DSM 25430]AVG13066.1 ABC transporter-like protein [Paenibacillus larvae subsp. larvae DSM 25430]QHZ51125.1 ABC transporter-like protein [Paenibacillus larvae subsp. larvae]